MGNPFQSKFSTWNWQRKNAEFLIESKLLAKTGEKLRLYKVPAGKGRYSLFGFRGGKGLEPIRKVEIDSNGHLNPSCNGFGVVDAGRPNSIVSVSSSDLKTGKDLHYRLTANGDYYDSGIIGHSDLRELGLKIDPTKKVEFSELEKEYPRLEEGHTWCGSVSKVQTNKGTLIQKVEKCMAPESEVYCLADGEDNGKKVLAQKITLFLNGEKVKEYFDDFYYGSKCVG